MGARKPSEEPDRTAPDGAGDETDDRTAQRKRRRRRAHEAGLQSLVRTLATRPEAERER
jgi:hypothetical protein